MQLRVSIADSDPSSDDSNADSANEIAALRSQLNHKDDTIAALRRENRGMKWNKNIGKFSPMLYPRGLVYRGATLMPSLCRAEQPEM